MLAAGFYAIDRLRLYCDTGVEGRLDAGKARGALQLLAPYSAHVDSQLQSSAIRASIRRDRMTSSRRWI
jgi:hypothetical protein